MRSHARSWLLIVLTGVLVALAAPAAAQASFGFEKFFAGNCDKGFETCGEGANEGSKILSEKEGFTQAGGHPYFGVTDFKLTTHEQTVPFKALVPDGSLKNLRVDVAPGVVTNPQAVPYCSQADFKSSLFEYAPGKFAFLPSKCPESSVIGKNIVETAVEVAPGVFKDFTLEGKVYNVEQSVGLGSEFDVAIDLTPLGLAGLFSHTEIEGNVEWATDYHDYFTIKNITPGLIESRLVFKGRENAAKEPTGFLRNPSACTNPGPETTTTVSGESYEGATSTRPYAAFVGTNNCEAEGFNPSLALTPETAISDQADGLTLEATSPHPKEPAATDNSDLRTASITFPEGLTMNPSAGAGLAGCTPEQIGIGTRNPVTCPSSSKIGTVNLEVPTLPPGSLQGPMFLGKPAGEQIKGPPYTVYFDAESARYGVKVRIKGVVTPNPVTGQLTTTFTENPAAPFNSVGLHLNGGPFAPLANPLVCGVTKTQTSFTPFSALTVLTGETPFTTEGCTSSPPPFSPGQSTSSEPPKGGSGNTFTINYERPEGQQYLGKIRTVLPPGVVGLIPTVAQCEEPAASAGTCTSASQIGTVAVSAGSGSPFTFNGKVYLTGPTEGAPYGLSIVVPPVAGPFTLPNVIARVKIEVDPHTAQVIATDNAVPTIVGGIPIRLRTVSISVNRQGFEINPTNCGPLATVSLLTSTLGATKEVASPFQAEGCSSLGFKPSFAAATSAKTSRVNGASLETTINQPGGQANINSVLVTLPKQLPSRLTTLQKACTEATFAANPLSCPAASKVGTARANTPVLPAKMTGPAILVSHGGAAFPDLDLVLEANGVRVIVVGNTDIKKGITTTNFATTPDVPVSSVAVTLPTGPHSALAAFGNLCTSPLYMPTVITAQNGKQFKQKTKINVKNCGVQIVGKKVVGNTAFLTVKTFGAGRIRGTGSGVSGVSRSFGSAQNAASLKIPLSSGGRSRHRPFRVKLRVSFTAKSRSVGNSSATTTVTFR